MSGQVSHFNKKLIFILDQAEESITKPLPSQKNLSELHELEELTEALNYIFQIKGDNVVFSKFVISYRKEYHPEIENIFRKKNLPYSELFLTQLARRGIIDAITGITNNPKTAVKYKLHLEKSEKGTLADIIADDLLEDEHSSIAPVLQVLLSKFWSKATQKKKHNNRIVFDISEYRKLKKEGILLKDFLNQQMKTIAKEDSEIIKSGLAIDILYYFTTPLVTAATHLVQEVESEYLNIESSKLHKFLQNCRDLYLLIFNEDSIRLSHDTLAPLIKEEFEYSMKPGQQARRILFDKVDKQLPISSSELMLLLKGENGRSALSTKEEELLQMSIKKHLGPAIKELLIRNDIATALRVLLKHLPRIDKRISNDVLIISSRYEDLTKNELSGIISTQDADIKRNQTINSLMEICDKIDYPIRNRTANDTKKYIEFGKLGAAIKDMREFYQDRSGGHFNELILLESRYEELNGKRISGSVGDEELLLQENRIISQLINMWFEFMVANENTPKDDKPLARVIDSIFIKKLRQLIAKSEITRVLEDLTQYIEDNHQFGEIHKRLMVIRVQFNRLNNQIMLGTRDPKVNTSIRYRITRSILEILDELEKSTNEITKIASVKSKKNKAVNYFNAILHKLGLAVKNRNFPKEDKLVKSIDPSFVKKMQKLIAEGKLRQVLDTLTELLENREHHQHIFQTLLIISSQFHQFQKRKTAGFSSPEEESIEQYKMADSILQILERLESANSETIRIREENKTPLMKGKVLEAIDLKFVKEIRVLLERNQISQALQNLNEYLEDIDQFKTEFRNVLIASSQFHHLQNQMYTSREQHSEIHKIQHRILDILQNLENSVISR